MQVGSRAARHPMWANRSGLSLSARRSPPARQQLKPVPPSEHGRTRNRGRRPCGIPRLRAPSPRADGLRRRRRGGGRRVRARARARSRARAGPPRRGASGHERLRRGRRARRQPIDGRARLEPRPLRPRAPRTRERGGRLHRQGPVVGGQPAPARRRRRMRGRALRALLIVAGGGPGGYGHPQPSRDAYDPIHAVYRVGVYGILGLLFIALIVRRVRGATAAGRRVLVPLMVATVFAATRAVSESVLAFVHHSSTTSDALYWWQIFGQIAVPIALLVGLLRAELARGTVADLVVELSQVPPGEVRDALARALHDDSLQVAYWLPMRRVYVGEDGRPFELPGDRRAVTKLDDIAAIVHDPELDAQLVAAAGAAARLAP